MKIYSTDEAASFLKVKPETIKHHVYKSKRLTPQKVGGVLIFTQDELERFKAEKKKAGRPKKSENNPPAPLE